MSSTFRSSEYPPPGTPLFVVLFGLVKHYGVVSDRWRDGSPMVISHSQRRRTTAEETWSEFAGGRRVFVANNLQPVFPPVIVVNRARNWIGRAYCPLTLNCDHHVRNSLGLPVKSPQLRMGLASAAAFLAVCALLGARPRTV